jgi:hypothetical protein
MRPFRALWRVVYLIAELPPDVPKSAIHRLIDIPTE